MYEEKLPEVYLTGVVMMDGKARVFLSNGDVYTSDDRELKFISKRMVIISGKKYGFAPPPQTVSVPVCPPSDGS